MSVNFKVNGKIFPQTSANFRKIPQNPAGKYGPKPYILKLNWCKPHEKSWNLSYNSILYQYLEEIGLIKKII